MEELRFKLGRFGLILESIGVSQQLSDAHFKCISRDTSGFIISLLAEQQLSVKLLELFKSRFVGSGRSLENRLKL
eukprot:10168342-Heterocapsa_arctica.AAC.1